MGKDSAGTRKRGMGRGNDAKTALGSHKRNQAKNNKQSRIILIFRKLKLKMYLFESNLVGTIGKRIIKIS